MRFKPVPAPLHRFPYAAALLLLAMTFFATAAHATIDFAPPVTLVETPPGELTTNHMPDVASDDAGHWVAVWQQGSFYDILTDRYTGTIVAVRSSDNGHTWSSPVQLGDSSDTCEDSMPHIETDGQGHWIACWEHACWEDPTELGQDVDILVSRSSDNGETWTPPVPLNDDATTDTGPDKMAQIAWDGAGRWLAVWASHESPPSTEGFRCDLRVAYSSDHGATWTPSSPLFPTADIYYPEHRNPNLATDRSGNWLVVWARRGTSLDPDRLMFARSSDNGTTWSLPAVIGPAALTGVDLNWNNTAIATDRAGNWLVAWGSHDYAQYVGDGQREVVLSRSSDNGATWSVPDYIESGADLDSFNAYGASLVTDGSGNWLAVWREIPRDSPPNPPSPTYGARSMDNGATWSPPERLDTVIPYSPACLPGADRSGHWLLLWQFDHFESFLSGFNSALLVSTLDKSNDTDWDGLPNDWETAFGLDPLSDTGDDGAAGDPDGDGLSNDSEYVWNTDPTDPASFPELGAYTPLGLGALFVALGAVGYRVVTRRLRR